MDYTPTALRCRIRGMCSSGADYRTDVPPLEKTAPTAQPQHPCRRLEVYAPDLLGFGASDKPVLPGGYSIELWAELLADFTAEFVGPDSAPQGAVLVGNSIGSLVCLTAAAAVPAGRVAGLCFLNSAAAMNNKGVVSDWRIVLALPIFWLIDLLLSIRPVAQALFGNVRDREVLAKVLQSIYGNKEAVDDDLVSIIAAPSYDAGALDVFVSVITGPPGPKPWDLLPKVTAPIFIAWGDSDPFTPLDGPVGQFFEGLPASRPDTTFSLLQGVGHCPQDDRPELLHEKLLPWLTQVFGGQQQPGAGVPVAGASVADG
ncbi:hypothetical protein MNEG_5245 [Monoraphidium neglectum]|uniref:AB hydrolase-1 domain-containing protein n=1 Tax=Monoraphidium neglectum TaxID=145388 RepID=A0A0D2L7A0_9CHLO|nr:hypothetical protein MNEG_5245 [Monoraphidium neglectum]KIZ02714.1 hypothetical protein MNEG_5245 [Monoraphidium neglectum]|eukprot:XP_013901733.1 hypothetical protein MNEG_5245 [Monoraphidium neglectum]